MDLRVGVFVCIVFRVALLVGGMVCLGLGLVLLVLFLCFGGVVCWLRDLHC